MSWTWYVFIQLKVVDRIGRYDSPLKFKSFLTSFYLISIWKLFLNSIFFLLCMRVLPHKKKHITCLFQIYICVVIYKLSKNTHNKLNQAFLICDCCIRVQNAVIFWLLHLGFLFPLGDLHIKGNMVCILLGYRLQWLAST